MKNVIKMPWGWNIVGIVTHSLLISLEKNTVLSHLDILYAANTSLFLFSPKGYECYTALRSFFVLGDSITFFPFLFDS